MTLQIVGAGVGRTGTHSLKIALEQLLGGTCHHMIEVFTRPDHVESFTGAINGQPTDWAALYDGFTAMVDFPGSLFWRETAAAFPNAPVLLSSRDAHDWYRSASNTIFESISGDDPWMTAMRKAFNDRFCDDLHNEDAMVAAFERHNADVRAEIPPSRLIDWTPSDGWDPICAALQLPVPDMPFPLTNTTKDFREMIGLDPLPEDRQQV